MSKNQYDHLTNEEKIQKIADAITWYVELSGNKDKLLQKIAEIVNIELPKDEPVNWKPPYGVGGSSVTYRDATNAELIGQYQQDKRGKVLGAGNKVEENVASNGGINSLNVKVW